MHGAAYFLLRGGAGRGKKWPILGVLGGTKNGTWGARIKILRPLFNTNTPLKPPFRHFGNHFGPRKSDFWPFYLFWSFSHWNSHWSRKIVPTWEGKVEEQKQRQFWNQWTKWQNLGACKIMKLLKKFKIRIPLLSTIMQLKMFHLSTLQGLSGLDQEYFKMIKIFHNFRICSYWLLMEGQEWSKSVSKWSKCSIFSKITEDAHLDGLSGVEQGSSSVENFHGLKPLHLPLMFQKRRGKVWARIVKVSGRRFRHTYRFIIIILAVSEIILYWIQRIFRLWL